MRKKYLVLGWLGQPRQETGTTSPTNQRKDPFHLYSLSPHSPQFHQSAGATLLLCMGQIVFVLFSALWTVVLYTHRKIAKLSHSAVDRHCFDADPDPEPNFHFDAIQIRIRIWTSIKTMPILMRILPQVLHIRIRIFLLFVIALPLYFVFYISHQCQMCRMFSVFWTAYWNFWKKSVL